MSLHLTNTIVNGEVADAAPVDQNYKQIQDYINTEVITRDGSVAMQAPLMLQAGVPLNDDQAVSKSYVEGFLPVGIMLPWPSPNAPSGDWMLCNGAALAVAGYPELYGVLGTRYGSGAGTFLLPNLTGRTLVGLDVNQTELNTIGKAGGTFALPLPAHSHTMPHTHPMPHTHEMPHLHSIAHDHAAFNAPLDNVTVQTAIRDLSTPGNTQSLMTASATGVAASHTDNPIVGGTATVNVPNYTGNSGQPDDATTDASSAASTGAVSTARTDNEGTANAKHFAPYVVVNYIIRVR